MVDHSHQVVPLPTRTAKPPSSPITRYRWVICGLLFFATTINYIDRQILSLLKPILDEQLHWTSTQLGAVNSAFHASYGLSLFFFGCWHPALNECWTSQSSVRRANTKTT